MRQRLRPFNWADYESHIQVPSQTKGRRIKIMSRWIILCILIQGFSSLHSEKTINAKQSTRQEITEITLTLHSANPDKTMRKFQLFAAKNGGFLVRLSNRSIQTDIPDHIGEQNVLKEIGKYGRIIRRNFRKTNVGDKLLELKTSIKLRKQHLAKLYALFQSTDFKQTLSLEKEITQTVQRLESDQGLLSYYQERMRYMHIRLNLYGSSGTDAGLPPAPGTWVRHLNLQNFIRNFDR